MLLEWSLLYIICSLQTWGVPNNKDVELPPVKPNLALHLGHHPALMLKSFAMQRDLLLLETHPTNPSRRCSTLSLSVAAKKSNRPGSSSCSWRIPIVKTSPFMSRCKCLVKENKRWYFWFLTIKWFCLLWNSIRAKNELFAINENMKTLKGVIAARVICWFLQRYIPPSQAAQSVSSWGGPLPSSWACLTHSWGCWKLLGNRRFLLNFIHFQLFHPVDGRNPKQPPVMNKSL